MWDCGLELLRIGSGRGRLGVGGCWTGTGPRYQPRDAVSNLLRLADCSSKTSLISGPQVLPKDCSNVSKATLFVSFVDVLELGVGNCKTPRVPGPKGPKGCPRATYIPTCTDPSLLFHVFWDDRQ